MTQIIELRVPDIGDYKDVPVIEVLVAVGDTIAAETALVTLESDKATMDVPSSAAGRITEILVKTGDRVGEGSLIARLEVAGAATETEPQTPAVDRESEAKAETPTSPSAPPPAPSAAPANGSAPAPNLAPSGPANGPCGPSVRRLARQLGVNLAQVVGSGAKGRIRQEDVIAYVKRTMQAASTETRPAAAGGGLDLLPWPKIDFEKFGPIERRPRSRIQKISATNLHRNWVMMPHVTNFDEADITDLEAFRQKINGELGKDAAKVTMLAFLIKAAVHTLQTWPTFNCSLEGDEIVEKRYWHIGFAADTPNGLVVPVIRDADRKSVLQIAAESSELARLAREGKLKPEQMQGGCFTVSSLGGIGGTGFTPIINAPEVAILGVTRSTMKPVWDGQQFVPRLTLPLCLSWDHRAVDGAAAARFLVHLSKLLADFRRVML
ncbi:dihydrolipoyllysine-residue acetyltransferase [Dechloromonas sp. CZR5]|uniref:dihydrolipoyllysine-residue acetyltransferase n=1 Tax=Dechloromonas sp. CZR5 TaxID=2608630 RepID=UPI00123D3CC3|nr:dihydrolipoyllysine-residue acetyltransferase [Dechloromonas sp. CZR5]